jgi:hypothetical protein
LTASEFPFPLDLQTILHAFGVSHRHATCLDHVKYLAIIILDEEYKHASVGEISGSHGNEYEDGCLLGCCAM